MLERLRNLFTAKPPTIPPEYEVLAELGRGTSGVVYKARDIALNRVVALKLPPLAPASNMPERLARARREAEVLAQLTCDPRSAFPMLHEVGEYQGQPYFVREFVEGSTFEQLVNARALPFPESVAVLAEVARAVQQMHNLGIAHRNLHPSNILVAASGAAKLIGFGNVGLLAGSDMLPSEALGVPPEVDVQALMDILGWLSAAFGQPAPPTRSVGGPTAFAEALDGYYKEQLVLAEKAWKKNN